MSGAVSNGKVALRVDRSIYDVGAVKRAAYRFLDKCSTRLQSDGQELVLEFSFPPATSQEQIDAVLADFHKELLDQDLRQDIARETAGYRNTILSLAFRASGLQERE